MNILKSTAYRHAERALKAASTQREVDAVVYAARSNLSSQEFGRFLKRVLERRREMPERYEDGEL